MWEFCGMARNESGLKEALKQIPELREQFHHDLALPGSGSEVNQTLELAGRVADFLDLGELMCLDALERRESCGGHFREEWQTEEGEAKRDDDHFCHVAAWEYMGAGQTPSATWKSSRSTMSISRPAATSKEPGNVQNHRHHSPCMASEECRGPGRLRRLPGQGRQYGNVIPGNAGCGERGSHPQRRRSHRVRP